MISDRTARAKARRRRAARAGRRHPARLLVVPIDDPRTLHRPPSEALHAKFDRRADGSFGWRHLERLAHLDAALCEWRAAIGHDQFVNAAVVFWNLEVRSQPAVLADVGLPKRPGRFSELLAAKVIVVFDDPATLDRL